MSHPDKALILRLPADLYERLRIVAWVQQKTIVDVVRAAVVRRLELGD